MRIRLRRRAVALAASAALVGALAFAVLPNSAGASGGDGGALLVKALGSRYTDASFVSGVGRQGKTQTFQLLITNTGDETGAFDVNLFPNDEDPVSWGFYDHHRFVPENEYSTQMIPPGGTFSLQVVAIPSALADPGSNYQAGVTLTPDGVPDDVLSCKVLDVAMTAEIGSPGMMFLQAAGQAVVGGDDDFAVEASSTAIVAPKSATYKITLVNNSGDTSNLFLEGTPE